MSEEDLEDRREFGLRLARLRQARGMSQNALADTCDMNKNTLSLLELGRTSLSYSTVISLCKALHCTANDLYPERLIGNDTRHPEIRRMEEQLFQLPQDIYTWCMETIMSLVAGAYKRFVRN